MAWWFKKTPQDLVGANPDQVRFHTVFWEEDLFHSDSFSCMPINKDFPGLFDRIFPESLRWLLATQQYCRSKWIMGHIAEKNRVNMELDTDNILTGNTDTNFKEIGIKRLLFTFWDYDYYEIILRLWLFDTFDTFFMFK